MNARESVDLMKGAIGLMLLCLLIGATVSFFYMLYDNTDERVHSMQKAVTSSGTERLFELQDKTLSDEGDFKNFPLVTNVANVLKEYNEDALLYILITPPNGQGNPVCFTYSDTNIQPSGFETDASQIPVTMACKYLLGFSNCRASVRLGTYDPNTGQPSDSWDGNGFLYIDLYLYVDPLSGG